MLMTKMNFGIFVQISKWLEVERKIKILLKLMKCPFFIHTHTHTHMSISELAFSLQIYILIYNNKENQTTI